MSVTLGTYRGEFLVPPQPGWTVITASSPSGEGSSFSGAGTRKVYVSNAGFDAEGTGANQGDGSQAHPYATILNAESKMRNGFPDWMLLKKGDVWTEGGVTLQGSGISADEPWLITSYGTGAQPQWRSRWDLGAALVTFGARPNGGNFNAIIDIDFYAYTRDPGNVADYDVAHIGNQAPGVSFANGSSWLLFEGCKFRFFGGNLTADAELPGHHNNFILRRNIIVDAYTIASIGGSGFHCSQMVNLTIEENLFDHNGYETTDAVGHGVYGFVHNMYISAFETEYNDASALSVPPPIIRGNIIARDASDSQLRSGAIFQNNLCVLNPRPFSVGMPSTTPTDISYNVVLEAKGNVAQNFEDGLSTGAYGVHYDHSTIAYHDNIQAHTARVDGGGGIYIAAGYDGSMTDNIFYDWHTPLLNYFVGAINTYGTVTPGSGGSAYPTFTGYIDDNSSISFTVTAANATVGATYTNSGQTFTVVTTIAGGTTLLTNGRTGFPAASGTLTKATGTGDATIAFSAFAQVAGNVLTVTSITGTPLAAGQKLTGTGVAADSWISALYTGTGGTGTYEVYINPDRGLMQLRTSQTFSIGNYFLPMSYVTSGAGTGAYAYIQVTAGAVSNVALILPNAYTQVGPGVGYSVGDNLTASVPGVTGFSVLVGSVAVVTTSGNTLDVNGDNTGFLREPFPFPNRSCGSYYNSIFGGAGATTIDFLTAARGQTKDTWDARLMADAVNTYIRVGFGISGGGSFAVDSRRYKYVDFNA